MTTIALAVKPAWNRLMQFVWVSLQLIVGLAIFLKFAPSMESEFFPVLKAIQPINVVIDGRTASFYLSIYKARPCQLASTSWSAVQDERRVPMVVKNPLGQDFNTNRPFVPAGYSLLGPYAATLPDDFDKTDKIEGLLYYNCHAGWLVEQIFGPVPISDAAQRKASQGSKF